MNIIDRLKLWKDSYKKEKQKQYLKRVMQLPKEGLDIIVDKALQKTQHLVLQGASFQDKGTYLFMALGYKNWQMPGGIINLTLSEAESATTEEDCLLIKSHEHKTAATHGPAIYCLKGIQCLLYNKLCHHLCRRRHCNIFKLLA